MITVLYARGRSANVSLHAHMPQTYLHCIHMYVCTEVLYRMRYEVAVQK